MDTWSIIDTQAKVLKPFYGQVDKTRKRLNLTPYEMRDYKGNKMTDVINVTENKSATYVMRIIAGLMSARWQTVIEGQLSTRESHKIEQFIDANLQQTDEYLFQTYGIASLDAWLSNHVCHTSLIGVEWMCRIEDGEYKIHCLPCDMRWTPFVLNKWYAPITFRSKEDLLQELEKYEKIAKDRGKDYEYNRPGNLADTDNEVRDYWDEKTNELWISKARVFKQPNTYKTLPFVSVWPPSGFMFRDKGYMEHESPSLLVLNEQLFDQLSRQLSIDATLGNNVLNPRYEKEKKELVANQPSEPVPERGTSQDVLSGERHLPVPDPDINRAELASRDQVNRLIEEAGPLAPRSYATPPSAVEVATEVELLDELQNPRIIALQMFKSQLARMMIAQFTQIAESGQVIAGRTGKQYNFVATDLKDPKKYAINYTMLKQNKKMAIINESRALAAWGRFPTSYILKDVLAVEDPDGWLREMELEKAKAANPAIGLAEMAVRYAEQADDTEDEVDRSLLEWQWKLLVHDYVMLMRSRMQPVQPAETQNLREATKQTGNPNAMTAVMGPASQGMLGLAGARQTTIL